MIQQYIDSFLSDNIFNELKEKDKWNELEHIIGHIFFGLASFFAPSQHKAVPFHKDINIKFNIPDSPRPDVSSVQYLAINFRGLYRKNGRETIVAPYNDLYSKCDKIELHRKLHHIYMNILCRKSQSINQLFLSSTHLNNISIEFTDSDESSIEHFDNSAKITIGKDINQLWHEQIDKWKQLIDMVLDKRKKVNIETISQNLASTRNQIIKKLNDRAISFISTKFFNQWLNDILHNPAITKPADAVMRFEQVIISICWLAFYCNSEHAGTFFYSARLPNILQNYVKKYPISSLSLVTSMELNQEIKASFFNFSQQLLMNEKFLKILDIAKENFNSFISKRIPKYAEGDLGKIKPIVKSQDEEGNKILPIDFQKLEFLLRMSRLLVNQKHEGNLLHFCLIFGFTWERIDSESKGKLRETISGLNDQWEIFEKNIIHPRIKEKLGRDWLNILENDIKNGNLENFKYFAEGMEKWIKTGDLPLQPWDIALFFEELDEQWPIPTPTSIVRISNKVSEYDDSIFTEFQLRKVLKELTNSSPSTAAILVGQTGLILFINGKAILIPCNSKADYNSSFSDIRIWGANVDEDRFFDFLLQSSKKGKFAVLEEAIRKNACKITIDLCEALVTQGHGALVVLHCEEDGKNLLKPLNPVWLVQPLLNGPELTEGILLYSLLSALDGATEICFSPNQQISFQVRKSVIPKKSIWEYDKDGYAIMAKSFKDIDALGLVGKGTRHHSALALSSDLKDKALVLTVSADGPVTLWQDGKKLKSPTDPNYEPTFKP